MSGSSKKKMGSTGKVVIPVEASETTVEIKIKTLDSQTYTLRVDKCVPVPDLKEQIASITGVLSEQQQLICRGKVLKDDQLLSAYHVEDGHTLHMVVRQPIPSSAENLAENSGTESGSREGRGQGSHMGTGMLVGTFSMSEPGDGALPDFSQILSAVLGSFGMDSMRNVTEGVDQREPGSNGHRRTSGLGIFSDSNRQQPDQSNVRGPSSSASSLGSQQPPVIPDSLTTLSQYLSYMRQEFSGNVRGENGPSLGTTANSNDVHVSVVSPPLAERGLPTPSSLAEVVQSTRQLLIDHTAECLLRLTTQLENHANVIDSSARMNIQSTAMRSGVLLRDLGALLLELGRTTMTLRMGDTPAEAVVNAGPAVFVSTSGPNPIMVQPFPFPSGTSLGGMQMGTVQSGTGVSGGTRGSLPRSVDLRIRTGPVIPSAILNQGEQTGAHQTPGQTNPSAPGVANPGNQDANDNSGNASSTREAEVRVVPIRTVVPAVPAHLRHSSSDPSQSSLGLLYPVLARVQHGSSGNSESDRGSHVAGQDREQQPPESVGQEQNGHSQSDSGSLYDQGFTSTLEDFLRTVLPDRLPSIWDVNPQAQSTSSSQPARETGPSTNTQETTSAVSDDGLFLSNLLRQIMPLVSQSTDPESNIASSSGAASEDYNGHASSSQDNSNEGASSRKRADDESTTSNPKRQKRQ